MLKKLPDFLLMVGYDRIIPSSRVRSIVVYFDETMMKGDDIAHITKNAWFAWFQITRGPLSEPHPYRPRSLLNLIFHFSASNYILDVQTLTVM